MKIGPHSLALLRSRAERNSRYFIKEALVDYDLTLPQWLALGFLSDETCQSGCRVADIGKALDVQNTYITAVLRSLETKGFVTWVVGPRDRRTRIYKSTKTGIELIQNVDSVLSQHSSYWLGKDRYVTDTYLRVLQHTVHGGGEHNGET